MKAATLKAFGSPLVVEDVPEPQLGTGEVIVDVVTTGILPYMSEVLSGRRRYLLDLPAVPGAGAIGRVRALGPDATRLAVGDWVFCDPTVRSRDDALAPDVTLQGLSARGDGGLRLQKFYHDGSFAQQMRVPTENAIPLGTIDSAEAERWTALTLLLVPYGGFLAANLQAGETVLVSGATGNFGSGAVAVALAMGAGCVVAPGRNEGTLRDLERRFGQRVRTVKLTGDLSEDDKRMRAAAPGPIDCVLDILPPAVSAQVVRSAIMTVRQLGRIVLMGGVGMLGGEELSLPYPWIMRNGIRIIGHWMSTREAPARLIQLIRSGALDLSQWNVSAFALHQVNEAVDHAANFGGPFQLDVLHL